MPLDEHLFRREYGRLVSSLTRIFGVRRLPLVLNGLAQIERKHPIPPHWYLAVLGTDPDDRAVD